MIRTRIGRPNARLHLEFLEERSVPSTFTVNTTLDDVTPANGKFSLREAITKANTTPGADVIVVPAGIFKITVTGAGEDANATGDFDIKGPLTIQGAGAGTTTIDAQQIDRAIEVIGTAQSPIKVALQGLTIRNGNVTGEGGGIRFANGTLVLADCAVTGSRSSDNGGGISTPNSGPNNLTLLRTTVARNFGLFGGGVFFRGDVFTVRDSAIRRNIASNDGGGIETDAVTMTNSIVGGNVSGGDGGGIMSSEVTLANCTIGVNTTSGTGGGIRADTATLTNCNVSSNVAGNSGGGIRAFGTATLTSSTVSGNSANGGTGGGINAVTATLTGSTVSGNTTSSSGGGIDAGTATLTASTVSGNSAPINGGGLRVSTATLTNCTISGNTAGIDGGGLLALNATLKASTVSGNRAGTSGGGIRATTATLLRDTLSTNRAGTVGGGIDADTATMTNCTVVANTAGANGGGVFAANATLLNCTVVENLADFGGGIFRNGGTFNVKNTIVALNLVDLGGSGPDAFGSFTSQGHNLIGDGAGGTGFTNGANGDIVGSSLNPIDPKFGPLADNGGPTKTLALLTGSRAIDAGDNTGIPATDQRGTGFARKKDGNGDGLAIVDIGAFER